MHICTPSFFTRAVRPASFNQTAAVRTERASRPHRVRIATELASDDIAGALMRHTDGLIEATAIGVGVERAWLEEQTPDVLATLAARVLEVNADFFLRRVLPIVTAAAQRMAQAASGGTSGSPDSSMPDSPTVT
jgi:hypothetical protein